MPFYSITGKRGLLMNIAGNIRSITNLNSCGRQLWLLYYRIILHYSNTMKAIPFSLPANEPD
jgi:hypothetical protein